MSPTRALKARLKIIDAALSIEHKRNQRAENKGLPYNTANLERLEKIRDVLIGKLRLPKTDSPSPFILQGTQTGRHTCSSPNIVEQSRSRGNKAAPNLQNVPVKTDGARQIKKAFAIF